MSGDSRLKQRAILTVSGTALDQLWSGHRTVLMSLARRLLAALSGAFLLQLLLLASGTLCSIRYGPAHAGAPADAMAMAGTAHTASLNEGAVAREGESEGPAIPLDCDGIGDHAGCRLPFAPGQCTSMTACSMSVASTVSVASATYTRTIALAVPSPVLGHSGPTFAPELPPPRA